MDHLKYCGERGRRQVLKLLTESQDPWKTIAELQETLSLGSTRCESAVSFLNEVGCLKSEVHRTIFDRIKFQLEKMFDGKSEQHLTLLLRSPLCVKLVTQPELRPILINIITRLKDTPKRFLQLLSKNNCLHELPMALQRKAWEDDGATFDGEMQRLYTEFAGADGILLGPGRELFVRSVKADIGHSENLYAKFCSFCVRKFEEDRVQVRGQAVTGWPGLLLDIICSHSSTAGDQMKRYRKLSELALLLESVRRQGFVDAPRLLQIFRLLRVLLMGQAAELDKNIVVSRRRMVNQPLAPPRGPSSSASKSKPTAAREKPIQRSSKGDSKSAHAMQELEMNPYARLSGQAVRLALKDGWKEMTLLDHHRVFAERVTDDIAPGYSQIITKPMDLGAILRRLGQSDADGYSLLEMDLDLQLMFTNCLRYNGPDSFYTDYARRMRRDWAQVRGRLLKRITTEARTGSSGDEYIEAEQQLPTEIMRAILLRAWEAMSREDSNGFFAEPVTDDIAPNYSVEIAEPMDLATMLQALEAGKYKALDQFDADVRLICQNCVQYNGAASVYGKAAIKLQKFWTRFRPTIETDVVTAAKQYETKVVAPMAAANGAVAANGAGSDASTGHTETLRSRPEASLDKAQLAEALKSLLNYLVVSDEQGIFAFPDASRSAQSPMDLSTMRLKLERGRYKSAGAFCSDVATMVGNYVGLHWEPEKRRYAAAYFDKWCEQSERLLGSRPAPLAFLTTATTTEPKNETTPAVEVSKEVPTSAAFDLQQATAPPVEATGPSVHGEPVVSAAMAEPTDVLPTKLPSSGPPPSTEDAKTSLPLVLKVRQPPKPPAVSSSETRRQSLLDSTRKAVKLLPQEEASEIPGLAVDGPLMWAALLLREEGVQSAVRHFLSSRLRAMAQDASSHQGEISNLTLPFQDPYVSMAAQLCQVKEAATGTLPDPDPNLVRVGLPLIVYVLTAEAGNTSEQKISLWKEVCPSGSSRELANVLFESCLRA